METYGRVLMGDEERLRAAVAAFSAQPVDEERMEVPADSAVWRQTTIGRSR